MPDIYKRYMEAIDWYVEHIKNDRIPDLKYAAAVITLRYRDWPVARQRLSAVAEKYCGTKSDVGFKAYDAILQTYFIDFNVPDEEQKDCALGKLLSVAEQFGESPCGKSPAAKPYLDRFAQIKSSVKTTIITKRLQLSMENEEKGTHKELVMCQSGPGGIAIVTGAAQPAKAGEKPAEGAKTPTKSLSTELDVGLALDLIDVVNANPKDPGAPTALNNACVIYEKLFQFGEATKCYERLYSTYPDSEWGKEALWNASRNHYRFFEFDQAVKGYLNFAQDPRFAQSEHRKEALGLAASLLDNDQQYMRAADLYKKYSDAIADKPQDSAQAYFFACSAYEKATSQSQQLACLKDFIKKYDKQPAAGEYVVQAFMKQAVITERTSKNKNDVLAAYKRVRDEFINRKLPPATPAAGFAAKADFLIMEEKFKAFQKKELKFGAKPDQIKKTFDSFTAEAKQLNEDYQKIWAYKGRDLDARLVPPLWRRLLRVRAEAHQGRRQSSRGRQEAGQDGLQGQPRRLRRRRGPVQGRHLPVRDPRRGRGEAALEGHARPRGPDGRHQRVREEGAREPLQVPSRRVPVREGRAHRIGVPMRRLGRIAMATVAAASLAGLFRPEVALARRQPPPPVIPTEETKQAEQLYRAARYPDAVAAAKAALNKNERYTPAMLVMAKAYYKLHKYEWMKKLWEMMQANGASNSEKAEIYQLLAFLEIDQKNVPGAIALFKQAAEAQPENAILWNNLGAQYLAAKNYADATPVLERASQLQPGSPRRI
jgi:hypothetical protein